MTPSQGSVADLAGPAPPGWSFISLVDNVSGVDTGWIQTAVQYIINLIYTIYIKISGGGGSLPCYVFILLIFVVILYARSNSLPISHLI